MLSRYFLGAFPGLSSNFPGPFLVLFSCFAGTFQVFFWYFPVPFQALLNYALPLPHLTQASIPIRGAMALQVKKAHISEFGATTAFTRLHSFNHVGQTLSVRHFPHLPFVLSSHPSTHIILIILCNTSEILQGFPTTYTIFPFDEYWVSL